MQVVKIAAALLFTFLSITCLTGCSSHKLRLPVEEINRPISLPPENWRIGIGTGRTFFSDYYEPEFAIEPIFLYPYFQLGSRWEYYIPGYFRVHLQKDIEIKDSVVHLVGANSALSGGIVGFSYSQVDGFRSTINAAFDFKLPITDQLWFVSNLSSNYMPRINNLSVSFQAGIGLQLTRHFFGIVEPSVTYKLINEYGYSYDYTFVNLPLVLGVNINERWSLYLKNQFSTFSSDYNEFTSIFGFSYSW